MKETDKVRDTNKCSVCERNTRQECGRVVCGNRRPVTANIPDGSHANFFSDGSHRHSKIDEN